MSFTTRVATRIFFVSSWRFLTVVDRRVDRRAAAAGRVGASASRSLSALSGLSGVTRKVSGSGLEPEQLVGLRVLALLLGVGLRLETYCTF